MKAAIAMAARPKHHPPGYRRAVLSRGAAAIFGGYALATLLPLLLAEILPLPKAEAVMAGLLLSFTVYTVAAIWVFAVRTATRAWNGMLISTALCAALWWIAR